MSDTTDAYERELNRARAEWRGNWALPIGSAYANAHARFQNTLQDQTKADQLKAQIAVMALTMGIGGGLSVLFGKSALSAATVDAAVTYVCDRNMTRALNAMAAVEASPTATFLLGAAWSNLSQLLSDATKRQITSLIDSTPPARDLLLTSPRLMLDQPSRQNFTVRLSARNLAANPQVAQNKLDSYVERVYAACLRSLEDLIEQGGSSVDAQVQEMRSAPFLQSPRSTVLTEQAGGELRAELEMELAMYMVLVMDLDYFAIGEANSTGGVTASSSVTRTPINVPLGHPDYPQEYNRMEIDCNLRMPLLGNCISGDTSRQYGEVRYRNLGSTIERRIERLYDVLIDGQNDFFRGRMGGHEIRRAQTVTNTINQRYERSLGGSVPQPTPVGN